MKPPHLALILAATLPFPTKAQPATAQAPLFAITGNLGPGYAPAGLGAMGWNYTSGRAEVDFFNNVATAASSFAWYQLQPNGPPRPLARIEPDGTFLATAAPDEVTLGRRPIYPESNPTLAGRLGTGIATRDGGLYIYRQTYGTFGQAAAASIIANSAGAGMPQISGFVTPADAGAGGERGSAALYIENNAPPTLDIQGVTFDPTHVYLPASSALTKPQIAQYAKPGTFLQTSTRGPQVGPFTGQVASVSDDGQTVTVTGWWLQADPSPGQNPTAAVGQPPPYTARFGVINTIWGQDTNVSLAKDSFATSAFMYEGGVFNNTGHYARGTLSDPLTDTPVLNGMQIANGMGDASTATSAAFWVYGRNWTRGFTATGIADAGAGFVYGDKTSTGTAFYSAQTAGAFLSLNPHDGPPVFTVGPAGDLHAATIAIGKIPTSPRGLPPGTIWANPSTHVLSIVP